MSLEQDIERTLDPDFVAPAPSYIPSWAVGLIAPFAAPASCHIPLWAAGLVNPFLAPALRVNVTWWCGLDRVRLRCSSDSETEWQTERIFEGGRRPTKGHSGIKREMIRQRIKESEWRMRTERSTSSVCNRRLISLLHYSNLRSRLPFCGGTLQLTEHQPREN